jgi:hypothetical protein
MDVEKLPFLGKRIQDRRSKAVIKPPAGRSWTSVNESPHVTSGRIHIVVNNGTGQKPELESMLSDGQELVLTNDAAKDGLELKGQPRYGNDDMADNEGIYINPTDFSKYTTGANLVVRGYSKADTFAKVLKSKALAGTAVVTLAAAVSGVGNAFLATPSGVASTQIPQSIIAAWTDEPNTLLRAPNLTTEQVSQVQQLIQARTVVGTQCLHARDGHASAPPEPIPGVDCAKPNYFKTTHFWGIITALLALVTGAFGLVALSKKFGFQGA